MPILDTSVRRARDSAPGAPADGGEAGRARRPHPPGPLLGPLGPRPSSWTASLRSDRLGVRPGRSKCSPEDPVYDPGVRFTTTPGS